MHFHLQFLLFFSVVNKTVAMFERYSAEWPFIESYYNFQLYTTSVLVYIGRYI